METVRRSGFGVIVSLLETFLVEWKQEDGYTQPVVTHTLKPS